MMWKASMSTARKLKPTPGCRVQVNDGVTMPEFPTLSIAGWSGKVMETTGSGSKMKVILEWDDQSLAAMSDDYKQHCESQGLMFEMACLPVGELSVAED